MNINQIRKCYDLCDALEKEGLERCFIDAIRGTLSVKQTLWDKMNPSPVLKSFGSMSCDVFDDKKGLMTHVVRDFKVDSDGGIGVSSEPINRPSFSEVVCIMTSFQRITVMQGMWFHPHFIALNFV